MEVEDLLSERMWRSKETGSWQYQKPAWIRIALIVLLMLPTWSSAPDSSISIPTLIPSSAYQAQKVMSGKG